MVQASNIANFIDFAKAFHSVHRPALRRILSHHGIPDKVISIVKVIYTDFVAQVICGPSLTEAFPVETGVNQSTVEGASHNKQHSCGRSKGIHIFRQQDHGRWRLGERCPEQNCESNARVRPKKMWKQ